MDMEKARRRIRRFIANPEKHQARVYATEDANIFEYKVKHYIESLFFKLDKLGRLRLIK